MEKISNIFWTQDHQWGTFVKKVIFPLEKMKILFKKSEKKVWLDQEWSGRIRPFNGYFQLENIFFSFSRYIFKYFLLFMPSLIGGKMSGGKSL